MQRSERVGRWGVQECDTSVEITSFQVNSKLVSLRVVDSQKKAVRAALESIGLRPLSQQNGTLLVLQTDQVHIRGPYLVMAGEVLDPADRMHKQKKGGK
jgi:hypothetical protein